MSRFLTLSSAWVLFGLPAYAADTALDRYVKQADPTYKYQVINTVKGDGFTSYIVEMTSQTWRKPTEVDRNVWKHWLTIIKPDRVDTTTAYLFISGGSTKDKAPNGLNGTYTEIALTTHSVAAELQDIPNEPVTFADDPQSRSEDGIIASNHGRPKLTPAPRSSVLREILVLPGIMVSPPWAALRPAADIETAHSVRSTQSASGPDNHSLSTRPRCGLPYRNPAESAHARGHIPASSR